MRIFGPVPASQCFYDPYDFPTFFKSVLDERFINQIRNKRVARDKNMGARN